MLQQRIVRITILLVLSGSVQAKIVHTIFGDIDESNPAILELLDSKAMQRLKAIDQSGPEAYLQDNFPRFSRYEHSLGVYALLKRYNLSIEEQIAGLLHDASHTVFSHLGDLVFQSGGQRSNSYQDDIHDVALHNMQVDQILAKYKLSLADVSPKNTKFLALEQQYPDMNADRIEYNLHTGLAFSDLSKQDIEAILAALVFANNKWYFTDLTQAKKFAKLSTYYNKAFWGSPHNQAIYAVGSTALKYALQHKIVSYDDLHMGVDQAVWSKLTNSNNKIIQQLVTILYDIDSYYVVASVDDYDVFLPIKMRGIDPLVAQDGGLQRLSDLSIDFKNDLLITAAYCKHGAYLKFSNIQDPTILRLIIDASR